MSAKGKLIRNCIIAVVSLCMLIGGYYLAVKWKPENNLSENEIPGNNLINLLSIKATDIKSVKLNIPSAKYTLMQNDAGEISIPEFPHIEFDQTKLKNGIYSFMVINAEREISSDISQLEKFGLDNKDSYFTINLKNGIEHTFFIGNSIPGENSRYFMKKSENKIYVMPEYSVNIMLCNVNNYRNTNIYAMNISDVSDFYVKKGNNLVTKIHLAKENEYALSGIKEEWIMDTPYKGEGASAEKTSSIIQTFSQIDVIDFADDNPANMDTYGLGKTRTSIVITNTDGKTTQLHFGKTTENGVYMQIDDKPSVFVVDKGLYDVLNGIDPANIVSKLVRIHNIKDVKAVEIKKEDKSFVLEIDQSKNDEDTSKFKVNNNAVSSKVFKEFYQKVIGIFFVDYANVKPSNPFMMISYKLADNSTDTIKFYDYNERYYIVQRNSGLCMTVLKTTLNDLLNYINQY